MVKLLPIRLNSFAVLAQYWTAHFSVWLAFANAQFNSKIGSQIGLANTLIHTKNFPVNVFREISCKSLLLCHK